MNIVRALYLSLSLFIFTTSLYGSDSVKYNNTNVTKFKTDSDYSVEVHSRELKDNQYLQGTGFAVTDSGDFITAQHVVSGCTNVSVKYNNEWIKAEHVTKHKNSDIALIHISEKTHPIRISLEEGQAQIVKMMGYPGLQHDKFFEVLAEYVVTTNFKATGLFNVKTAADIWGVRDEEQKKNHIRGKYEGMSGGPILDSEGYVAGVIVAENATEPLIVTMLPNDILDLLDNGQLINNQRSKDIATNKTEMLRYYSITEIMCRN